MQPSQLVGSSNCCNLFVSVMDHAPHQLNSFPASSTSFDYFKFSIGSKSAGISDVTADACRKPSSALRGFPASTSDRTSKVARITELSQTIQSRLRGPMQELERHLECEDTSFCHLCNILRPNHIWYHFHCWLVLIFWVHFFTNRNWLLVWYLMLSCVCLSVHLSVMKCIVSKQYVLQQKCPNKYVGNICLRTQYKISTSYTDCPFKLPTSKIYKFFLFILCYLCYHVIILSMFLQTWESIVIEVIID